MTAAAAVDVGSGVRVIACHDAAEIAMVAADVVEQAAPLVLGVATGSSPEGLYTELVRRGALQPGLRLVLLDDYLGLPPEHPQRYRAVIERQLVGPAGLRPDALSGPDVDGGDPDGAAARYELELERAGGVDLQILGLGRNGHVGFNEPGTPAESRTHVATLADATRRDNARFFDRADEVPQRGITQGLATIATARRLLLLAAGAAKAPALAATLAALREGRHHPEVPASALVGHPHLVVVADRAALGLTDVATRPTDASSTSSPARAQPPSRPPTTSPEHR